MNKFFLITFLAISFSCYLSAQSFSTAESAEYDAANDRWLVSSGDIIAVAADGTLSFFGSAKGSYGLEILNNILFAVGTGGVIKGYNLDSADEVMSITIPGTGFLNGLTNDAVNKLYVTDFGNQKIIEVDVSDLGNPIATTIVENTQTTPNGIIYEGSTNRLIYTSWQSSSAPIKAVDLTDFSITDLTTTSVGNIDGIDDNADGEYFISSWSPNRITKYSADFQNPVTITTPFIDRPADIGYAMSTNVLGIPIGNNVVFVDLSPISAVQNISADVHQFKISPNPLQAHSLMEFHLENAEEIALKVVDQSGKFITTLLSGTQIAGWHKVSLAGHSFATGQYYALLTTKTGLSTVPFIITK